MSLANRRTGKVGPPPKQWDLEWANRLRLQVEAINTPGAYTPLGYTQSNNSYHLVGNLDGVALDGGTLDGHILSVGNESGAWGVDHRELTSPDSTIGVNITGTAIELTLGTTSGMSDWEDLSQSLEAGDKFFLHDLSEDALYRLDYITLADAINSRAHYQYVQPVGGGLLPDHLILEFAAPLVPSDAAGDFATRVDFDVTAVPLESNPVYADYVLFYDSSVGANRKCTLADLGEGIDHGVLLGLGDDDHTQYALLAGRSGGQHLYGGTGAGDDLWLEGTTHGTPGSILLGSAAQFAEWNNSTWDIHSTAPRIRIFDTDTTGSSAFGLVEFYDGTATPVRSGYLGYGGSGYALRVNNEQAGPVELYTSATIRATLTSVGNLGLGATPPANQRFLISYNPTDASTAQTAERISFGPSYSTGGPNSNHALDILATYGGTVGGTELNGVQVDARGNHSTGTLGTVRGAYYIARSTGAGTTTNLIGTRYEIIATGGSTVTAGTVLQVRPPTISGVGSAITTVIGLDIANQGHSTATTSKAIAIAAQSGSTTNWVIASEGGNSYHVGGLLIGVAGSASVSPGRNLEVRDGSNAQQRWSQASGVGVEMQAIAGSGWSLTPLANAAPGVSSINGAGGSGSNIAGGRIDVCGGIGTGTGVGGSVRIRTTPAGSSGSAANALATMLEVTGDAKIGLYGVTPVVRASAYTQTYATAARTVPAVLTDSTTGTPGTTLVDAGAAYSQANVNNNFASLNARLNTAMQLINSLIDDSQAIGIAA